MVGWILIFTFLVAWSGFGYWSRKVKMWSSTISIGGGFIVGCLFLIFIGFIFLPKANNPVEHEERIQSLSPKIIDKKEALTAHSIPKERMTADVRANAITRVKNSLCKQGGTVHECFSNKTSIPAVTDLGWTVAEDNDGLVVQKEIKLQGFRSSTIYRWHVSPSGNIEASNGHAITISGH